jgi:tRNA(Ile)-lysidine synthase
VRKELLPLLEELNPRFVDNVVRNSELFRQDSAVLNLAAAALLDRDNSSKRAQSLLTASLRAAPAGLRRRALRLWLAQHRGDLRRIEHAHIVAIENLLLSQKSGRIVELPGGGSAFRQNGMLHYVLVTAVNDLNPNDGACVLQRSGSGTGNTGLWHLKRLRLPGA